MKTKLKMPGPDERHEAVSESKAAHTPGPWMIEAIVPENHMGRDYFVVPKDNSEDWVAKIAGGECREANARLIAASPELYEACRSYHYAVVAMVTASNGGDLSCIAKAAENLRSIAIETESILAKSEGGK